MTRLEPYRRHYPPCPHTDVGYTKCHCPIWCYGYLDGRRRFSLRTKDWARAIRRIARLENPTAEQSGPEAPPMSEALDRYQADLKARRINQRTIESYMHVLESLQAHLEHRGIRYLDQVTTDAVAAQREAGTKASTTRRKELIAIRAFFSWCVGRKWIAENPARAIKPPRDDSRPTMPFEQWEIDALLEAVGTLDNANKAEAIRARLRARAFLLCLLYTGLRISDVAMLERRAFDPRSNRLTLRTEKTGVPVRLKVAEELAAALRELPVESERYFFWSGNGDWAALTHSMRRTLAKLTAAANRALKASNLKLVDVHPHRFRDTFACRLLETGADIRTVQKLLGHESVRTTEKHYAPWVAAHQALLDAATDRLDFVKRTARLLVVNAKSNTGGDA
jgi:site-specific recombinase XerD